MQVPEPEDPDRAVARQQDRGRVVDVFFFLPYDDGQFEREAVHVDDDAEHAVQHAQKQRKLEQTVDAGEQFHAGPVGGSEVADAGGAERGHAERCGRTGPTVAVAGHPVPPPRAFGLVHQGFDFAVQGLEPEVQRHAHQVE